MFDLPSLDTRTLASKGVRLDLVRPDGLPVLNRAGEQVWLLLLGTDSDEFRRAQRATLVETVTDTSNQKLTDESLDKADERALDVLIAATVAWGGVVDTGGKPVPRTTENVRAFFKAFPSAKEQADRFVGNRANFLLESPKPSSSMGGGTSAE